MHRGSCLCGEVRFTVASALPAPDACHCHQCRKQSGHFWASTDVLKSDLRARDKIAIAMGAFDDPTQTHLAHHIFVADKGDYYDIADGLPQNQQ
jgi:hypothetical protein